MKESFKKLLKNPIQKSISSLILSLLGFLLIRFDGTTTIDGLISAFGMTLFFLSILSFSFSLCEAVSWWMERDREREREMGKKEKKMKENNSIKKCFSLMISFIFSFLFLLSFHPSSIPEKLLFVFISGIAIFSVVWLLVELAAMEEEDKKEKEGEEKEKGSEEPEKGEEK